MFLADASWEFWTRNFILPLLVDLQPLAVTVSAGVIVYAALQYTYQKERDKILSVADQVAFFREKILGESKRLAAWAKEVTGDKNYFFGAVRLVEPTFEAIKEKYLRDATRQREFLDYDGAQEKQGDLLNLLEEFSIRVLYSGTEDHKALSSLKPAFVGLLEGSAIVFMHFREIEIGNAAFQHTLDLYLKWEKEIDRAPKSDRIAKLTKKLSPDR